ncbi:MAG: Gfo/Idh/MocA family oxidoreductase [Clostridiaceae bacterium]
MKKQFRACVIGMGYIGGAHIEALRRLGNVSVTAVASTHNPQAKAEAHCVPRGYVDYREMIENEQPDAVHICTPNDSHFEMAMYAMERGIAVILEKPMTRTLEEAKRLAEYAKEHCIINGVNFNCRWYPQVLQAKAMVQSGELGEIYAVQGSYLQDWMLLDTDYNWRVEPALSGESRVFADIGSHWIDMAETVTGLRVTEVMADFATFHPVRKKPLKPIATFSGVTLRPEDYEEVPVTTEDYCTVLYHFDNGAHGVCTVTQMMAGRKNQILLSIGGSKRAVSWNSDDSNELWIGRRDEFNQKAAKDPALLSPLARTGISYPGGHVEGYPDTFKQNFKAIYAAIEAGDVSKGTFATIEDGLREMEIGQAVLTSAKERRWVRV